MSQFSGGNSFVERRTVVETVYKPVQVERNCLVLSQRAQDLRDQIVEISFSIKRRMDRFYIIMLPLVLFYLIALALAFFALAPLLTAATVLVMILSPLLLSVLLHLVSLVLARRMGRCAGQQTWQLLPHNSEEKVEFMEDLRETGYKALADFIIDCLKLARPRSQ